MLTFSVITPTYNRANHIGGAVRSVKAQGIVALEHIIVDGGSSDNSLKVLSEFSDLTIISEPDDGLYDALNKGLHRARGDIIVWLNSDDQLLPDAFETALKIFNAEPDTEMVCGRVYLQNLAKPEERVELGGTSMQGLSARDLVSGLTLTNSRFMRRSAYERIGDYDTKYPIAADREYLARCLLGDVSVSITEKILYSYGQHDESLTFNGDGAELGLLNEYCDLAQTSFDTARTSKARRLYGRWASWALFYRMIKAPSTSGASLKFWRFCLLHPIAFFQLIDQFLWHAMTKKNRLNIGESTS